MSFALVSTAIDRTGIAPQAEQGPVASGAPVDGETPAVLAGWCAARAGDARFFRL